MNYAVEATLDPDDALVYASTKPKVSELYQDLTLCQPITNGWNRLLYNEQVRYARWAPQWLDGRKYDQDNTEALPWNGCSDLRIMMVDDAISEKVAITTVAFWRSLVQAIGVSDVEDESKARQRTKLLHWMIQTKQRRELMRDVELSAQYFYTYGQAVLHPRWDREVQQEIKKVKLEDFQQAAISQPDDSPMKVFPLLVQDPEREAEAVEALQMIAGMFVRIQFGNQLGEYAEDLMEDWELAPSRARKAVRSLRDEGIAEIPIPYFCRNQPIIEALKPFYDVFFRTGNIDFQDNRIHRREFVTEVELRGRVQSMGWDEEWVDKVKMFKGQWSEWTQDQMVANAKAPLLSVPWTFTQYTNNAQSDLIEIWWTYYWQIDPDDGVKTLSCTVWHTMARRKEDQPDGTEDSFCAWSGPVDYAHRQMPFIMGALEWIDRDSTMSRGIPERLAPLQQEVKFHRDGLINQQQIGLVPPVNIYQSGLQKKLNIGPLAQNVCQPGREPQPWDIRPVGADVAITMWERAEKEVKNKLGLLDADVPPTRSVTVNQKDIDNFLMMWTEAFQQQFALMEQYIPDGEYERITGDPKPLDKGNEILKQYDLILTMDARNLDMDHVAKQLEAITKGLLPFDTEHVISPSKLIMAGLKVINPSLVEEISQTPQAGAKQVQDKVESNVLKMMAGFQPDYGMDADPTAPMQLDILKAMGQQNPKIKQQMVQDPQFAQNMQKYVENLQFNIDQQQNAAVGRIGVNPNQPQQGPPQ